MGLFHSAHVDQSDTDSMSTEDGMSDRLQPIANRSRRARSTTDSPVIYGYSSSSSPNLPTISEQSETSERSSAYIIRQNRDDKSKFDFSDNVLYRYFIKTHEEDYDEDEAGGCAAACGRGARWPYTLIIALIITLIFVFTTSGLSVYYLVFSNTTDIFDNINTTFWEAGVNISAMPLNDSLTTTTESTSTSTTTPRTEATTVYLDISHCHPKKVRYCQGVMPYTLAGPAIADSRFSDLQGLPFTAILLNMNMFYNQNCSPRLRQFVCSLLEPECQPKGTPPKKPCQNLCKPIRRYCDHIFPTFLTHFLNCEDKYSETDCVGMLQPCLEDEVSCRDGTCIHKSMVCDGYEDCQNGADEQGCEGNQYRCPSTGNYIFKLWLCDGKKDCVNGEDESVDECRNVWKNLGSSPSDEKWDKKPGVEYAGSSPANAVTEYSRPSIEDRRGTRKPHRKSHRKHKTDEINRELLQTSDTSNALQMDTTRQLLNTAHSRLKMYNQSPVLERTLPPTQYYINRATTSEPETRNHIPKEFLNLATTFKPETKEMTLEHFERHIDPKSMVKAQIKKENVERGEKQRTPAENTLEKVVEAADHSSPCPANKLRCSDGKCISLAMFCDGNIDCSDHADEDNCYA